MQKHGVGDV